MKGSRFLVVVVVVVVVGSSPSHGLRIDENRDLGTGNKRLGIGRNRTVCVSNRSGYKGLDALTNANMNVGSDPFQSVWILVFERCLWRFIKLVGTPRNDLERLFDETVARFIRQTC